MGDSDKRGNEDGFGSRFLSGLKGLILEEEAPVRSTSSAEPEQETASADSARPVPAPSADVPVASAASSPMTASLMELVLGRATAYTALTEAMTPLQEIIPDEMTRYRAAFALIKKSRTLDQVVQAIDLQHMQILEEEMTRFSAQAKEKQALDVEARINEMKTLKANVDAANAQVIDLRRELENRIRTIEEGVRRDRKRADEIEREVEEKRQAIASVQRQFDSAAASVKESLLQAKAKILKYLP